MKKQYPYSNDKEFLSKIDKLQVREQWVKITLLEYNSEIPIEDIEGQITNGTLSKNGDSAVRRTCSLTCAVDAFKYNPDDIKSKYSISKKIYLELGITNDTNEYADEKIIWFPQGIFFISSMSISSSSNGAASINLQFKDKMAQLDGTVGGVLPATVRFDTITTIINDTPITSKTLVYDIIMETVNHFGGEDLSNIIIDDIPKKAKRIIRWIGSESLWIYPISNNGKISYDICFTSDLDEKSTAHTPILINGEYIGAKEYKPNQSIGYMYEDFVYDEELTFNAGSKVTDVLDKIKSWLGNYEYFYDEYGQFHFQEIKNYLNNSQSASIWNKILETKDIDYLHESTYGKAVYTFDDNINLISITNTPVYENIKNDFIVEGTTMNNNVKHTCRYHLVIDNKPTITIDGYDNVLIYTDPLTKNVTIAKPKIITPKLQSSQYVWLLPEFAKDGEIYGLLEEPQTIVSKKSLKNMDDFAAEYEKLVNQENDLIESENEYSKDASKNDLITLLENYMSYIDDPPYDKYHEIVITLAKQIERYLENSQIQTSLLTTEEYWFELFEKFKIYPQQDKFKKYGCLLKILKIIFENIDSDNDLNEYNIDENYWPAINTEISSELWDGINTNYSEDTIRLQRKASCLKYIDDIKIKQKQLGILIEQYTQILNNYNTRISLLGVNNGEDIENRNIIQNQINNYKQQQEICGKRLTLLYATMTELGASNLNINETYYTVDIDIPVYESSFWYYNTDKSIANYGWNKLTWYKYCHNQTNSTEYYPNGLGSMTYIDYSAINWEKMPHDDNDNKPSMNRYSLWYRNNYIEYAEQYNLPYISENTLDNTYIPKDWRTELLLMGLRAEENGTDPGYYYQELKANWPTIYDFKNEKLLASSIDYIDYYVSHTGVIFGDGYTFVNGITGIDGNIPEEDSNKAKFKPNSKEAEIANYLLNYENENYYYFFDMIDSSSQTWGEYSVNNIGRRTNVNVSDSVNCIFAPEIPNFAFINISGLTTQERREKYAELGDIAEDIIQITDTFYDNFATGSFKQSAYEQIRYDLQQHTSYQNTISITAIPCFYLEPNTRVKLNDHSTNTFGDYIIKTISIPLGIGNNMSLSLSKAMERI